MNVNGQLKMFQDSETVVKSFNSCWKQSKSSMHCESQSQDTEKVDRSEQTTSRIDEEIQTDEIEVCSAEEKFDGKALTEFLLNICPKVEKELLKNERCQAFTSYKPLDDEKEESVSILYTLPKPKKPDDCRIKVTALSWSCTGNVLAVACSSAEHSDWCNHNGIIRLYNIESASFNSNTPTRVLETTSCVCCVSMHPYEPSVMAVGTFSGDVLIWKLQDEEVINIKDTEEDSHSDPVTQLTWVKSDTFHEGYFLASAARDGCLIIWKGSLRPSNFKAKLRFTVEAHGYGLEPGISCFSFPPNQSSLCIVAVQGGPLYYCHLDNAGPNNTIGFSNELLESTSGTVTCIAFSPYHKNTFATTGTDLKIGIFTLKQTSPQLIIWCDSNKVGLEWSKTQANILTVWGDGGHVTMYDAVTGHHVKDLLPPDNQNTVKQLCAFQFNNKRPNFVAVGDSEGLTQIWKAPLKFRLK